MQQSVETWRRAKQKCAKCQVENREKRNELLKTRCAREVVMWVEMRESAKK